MNAALRWIGALAAMAAVAVLSLLAALRDIPGAVVLGDDGGSSPVPTVTASPTPTATGAPVEDGAAPVMVDFVGAPGGDGGEVRAVDAPVLRITAGEHSAAYFQFPLIPGDPACIAAARFELAVRDATPTELGVHPAAVRDPASLVDGAALPDDPLLTDEPVALAYTNGDPGRLLWDITELYQGWVSGEYTAKAPDAEATSLVLAVRAVGDDPAVEVGFTALENGLEGAPAIVWSGRSGCGVAADDDGTPASTTASDSGDAATETATEDA